MDADPTTKNTSTPRKFVAALQNRAKTKCAYKIILDRDRFYFLKAFESLPYQFDFNGFYFWKSLSLSCA